jgi:carboxyl-terminal processing protease
VTLTTFFRPLATATALCATLSLSLPASAATLPDLVANDVNISYSKLLHTFYHPVDDQALLDAAHDAIVDAARKHGVHVNVPPIKAAADDGTAQDELDSAIADAADAAHAPPAEFAYAVIDAMARAVGDKYTAFMDPAEYQQFKFALDPEKISGIGVLISVDAATKMIALTYVVPGTPADRAGLEPGDLITAIDGTSTKGLTIDDARKLLLGKAGTVVRLDTQRGTSVQPEMTIARSELQPPTVVYKMLPGNIGYVYILAFGQDTPSEFDSAIRRLKDQDAKALVLDLRDDGGGYVESALMISSRFIADRPLLTVQERGKPDDTVDAENDVMIDVPVTVLVNDRTASASEITAGALQDDGIAELIGTRTYGKGVMQTLTPLPDGAAIKITTAHYLTPSKRDINLKGIDPDVKVDEAKDARFGDITRDAQLRAAIDLLTKKIAATTKP